MRQAKYLGNNFVHFLTLSVQFHVHQRQTKAQKNRKSIRIVRDQNSFVDCSTPYRKNSVIGQILKIYLKHLLDVVIFRLQQLAPGSQVAVGQDPSGFQQSVGVTLKTRSDPTQHQSSLHSFQNTAKKKKNKTQHLLQHLLYNQ